MSIHTHRFATLVPDMGRLLAPCFSCFSPAEDPMPNAKVGLRAGLYNTENLVPTGI
jgi:hypothetical protein